MFHSSTPEAVDMTTSTIRSSRARRLVIALAASTLMLLAACSSDGSAGNVASVAAVTTGGDTDADPDEAVRIYRECMAEEGIDIPEPPPEGGNAVGSTTEVPPVDGDAADIAAADAKCSEQLPETPNPLDDLTPAQQVAFDDYMLEVEKCMADKGYEGIPLMGEDQDEEGGNSVDGDGAPTVTQPPDFDWDAFDQAASECYDATPLPSELEGIEP